VNTHVKSVEFSPNYSSEIVDLSRGNKSNNTNIMHSQFISTTLNQVSIWDALKENAPIDKRLVK
jgi:hypothetical protein